MDLELGAIDFYQLVGKERLPCADSEETSWTRLQRRLNNLYRSNHKKKPWPL